MWIRQAAGCFLGSVAILFLAINSLLLARGASKWGLEWWERISYGAVAATVPFVIAAMPLIISMSWKQGRRFSYPSILTLMGCVIWLAFVAYNLTGAASSIALVRDDVVSSRKHATSNLQAQEGMRERLTREVDAVPRHRPAGAVAPLLAARKAMREWEWTERCTDIRGNRQKRFCDEVTGLESELASARRAAELNDQISALSARVYGAGPAASIIDPEARLISNLTGWDEHWVSENIPLKTPILLELGSMTLLYFAAVLLGFTHQATADAPAPRQQSQAAPPGPLRPVEARQFLAVSPVPVSAMRPTELCRWFFRTHARPLETGSLPETQWYEPYTDVCRGHGHVPLPLNRFREVAADYVTVQEIDGTQFYLGALPYVPRRVA